MEKLNIPINLIIFLFCQEAGTIMTHYCVESPSLNLFPSPLPCQTKTGRKRGYFLWKKKIATDLAHENRKSYLLRIYFPKCNSWWRSHCHPELRGPPQQHQQKSVLCAEHLPSWPGQCLYCAWKRRACTSGRKHVFHNYV